MNNNRSGLFWGILLVAAGALALARQFGYIDDSAPMWIGTFAAISLLALVNYALSGWRQWGWLFPTGIFGGLAAIVALATANLDSAAVASPLFLGLLLPFTAAYLSDRARNWWALIPGGVMAFLLLVTLLVDATGGDEWIGALFLFMIAISFLVVYLTNRTRLWALIVAYVLTVLSIAPLMASGGRSADYYGAIFLFAIALPFFIVYFRSPENWWAVIPAGSLTTLTVMATLAIAGVIRGTNDDSYARALLAGGLAVTFAIVWLRHAKPWAKVVTIALAVVAVVFVFFAGYAAILWPVVIILTGIYLFYTALRPRTV